MGSPSSKFQNPFFRHWLFPGAVLVGLLLFDLKFLPNATITPVCSFLILALLAFTLAPVPMIFWSCAYTFAAIFVIYNPDIFRPGLPNHTLIHEIRTVTSILGGVLAVLLCFNRLKISQQSEQLALLVSEIPVPFVLSDGNGEIVLMNKRAAELLGVADRATAGDSYFSLLTDINRKGDCIQRYLEIFDAKTEREVVIELKPQHNPGAVLQGTLVRAEGDVGRYLITMISEPVTA